MFYRFIYFIYLFSTIFLTASFLPISLTPRQGMAIIMFFVCLIKDKRLYSNKYWGIYLIFILFYGLSSFVTGYFSYYLQRLMGDFFVAYVACWATKIYIDKYVEVNSILLSLAVFGLFDALITIGQVNNWPFATAIARALNLDVYASFYEALEYNLDMTTRVVPGLFRNGVMNGHFLMVTLIAAFILLNGKNKVIGAFVTLTILTASFLTQQRSGFFIGVVFVLFLLFRSQGINRSKYKYLSYIAITVIIIIVSNVFFQRIGTMETRYSEQGFSLTGREDMFDFTFDYYLNNFFFGGFLRMIDKYQVYPHNFFLNALITGGFFGGLAIIIMVFKQTKHVIIELNKQRKYDMFSWILGLIFIANVIDSMVHNISLLNGDVLAWISWTAFYHYKDNSYIVEHI